MAPTSSAPPTPAEPTPLAIRYASRGQLLAQSRVDGASLSIFVPSSVYPELGSQVRLYVSLGDCDLSWELTGTVTFHRTRGRSPGQSAGIAVAFEKEQKQLAVQMLAKCAGRPETQGTARTPRVQKQLRCVLQLGRRRVPVEVLDLSTGGAFISGRQVGRLQVGTEVVLQLRRGFLGFWARRLTARVVWLGQKRGSSGFGARFLAPVETLTPMLKPYLSRNSSENTDAST